MTHWSDPSAAPPCGRPAGPAKARLSPRRRRLRLTMVALLLAGALGVVTGLVIYVKARPRLYHPGERDADITSGLSRDLPADAPRPRLLDVTRAAGLAGFRTFVGERTSQLPEDMGCGAAWGDFNNDGYPDLFLVSAGGPLTLPTNQLAPCALYENLGNGTFRQVGDTVFPPLRIHGMGAAWGDYDGDGWLDLIVTGYNTLLLFHNEPGANGQRKFVPDPRFPNRPGFWAGAAWGDYDNDRRLDLYVCGYVRYVGNAADRNRASLQLGTAVPYTLNPSSYPPARNLLFHNNGDGTFTEVAEKLGVADATGRSLSALWHDFDDDGWLDLYVANDISDNAFYHNAHGRFRDVSAPSCAADYRSGMGLAAGDWHRDGVDDFFITHWVGQENALYHHLRGDLPARGVGGLDTPGTAHVASRSAGRPQTPFRFTDIADAKGLGQIALPDVGWGTAFLDLDGDGWLDLVVANGSTLEMEGRPKRLQPEAPFLFWNRRGQYFYNLAPLNPALARPHVGRGLAVADYDNDGAMDFLIMNLGEGVQLFRNEMQTGHWLEVRLRSLTAQGRPLGFGDGTTVIAHIGAVALRRTVGGGGSYLSQDSRVLHFGLGQADHVDRLEVRWHAGRPTWFTNLPAGAIWEVTEGDPVPHRFHVRWASRLTVSHNAPPLVDPSSQELPPTDTRARLVAFWQAERGAMGAMRAGHDLPRAIRLFRQALALNPDHEDARYYLAQCLAQAGDVSGALSELQTLERINPQSHRAFQQWGALRATFARSDADLAAAEQALEKARALNPEETGAVLVLGQVTLLRGETRQADACLAEACRTNPRAVGGFFLRGYLAWKRGDRASAEALLVQARQASGRAWQPKGATSEGAVQRTWHCETTPLSSFWEHWDGRCDPGPAFAALDTRLTRGQPAPPVRKSGR